ncbi:MAG TPA: hypothetical protein VIY86_05255, partial [Pirellulaceae bacterium]
KPIAPNPASLSDPLSADGLDEDLSWDRLVRDFGRFQSDAPSCDNCGSITVRNGNCYLCHNCGSSMGCS